MVSLTRHIREQQRLSPEVVGDLSDMMTQIALGGKRIARDLCRTGLTDMIGTTGETNVQGEQVQKLDERANQIFVEVFEQSEIVRIVVSEEMAERLSFHGRPGPDPMPCFLTRWMGPRTLTSMRRLARFFPSIDWTRRVIFSRKEEPNWPVGICYMGPERFWCTRVATASINLRLIRGTMSFSYRLQTSTCPRAEPFIA